MTKAEFAEEATKMYRGGNRLDDLTKDRLEAMWGRFGHLPAQVWKNATARVLLEPRWPSVERLEQLVGWTEDTHQKDVAAKRNNEAARATRGRGLAGLAAGYEAASPYQSACAKLLEAVLTQQLSPAQAADFLDLYCDGPGTIGGMYVAEWQRVMREAGADWGRTVSGSRLVRPVPQSRHPVLANWSQSEDENPNAEVAGA